MKMKTKMKTFRIEVYGRVQGVNFRRAVKDYADKNGIMGTVKNQSDGSVLIIAQCESDSMRKLLLWIESNPGFSKVKRAEIEENKIKKKFVDFEIVRENSIWRDQKGALGSLWKALTNKTRELD